MTRRYVLYIRSVFDRMIHYPDHGRIVFDPDPFRVVDQDRIPFIPVRTIHTQDIDSHFFEYGKIAAAGSDLFKKPRIDIPVNHIAQPMRHIGQVPEITDNLLFCSVDRKDRCKDMIEAIFRSRFQIRFDLFRTFLFRIDTKS